MKGQMKLSEFIEQARKGGRRNMHVRFPGFDTLYVRWSVRTLDGFEASPCLDLSSASATYPGNGAFTKLYRYLRIFHPDLWLFAENVLTPRFRKSLERMGFTLLYKEQLHRLSDYCYYMRPRRDPLAVMPEGAERWKQARFQFPRG